MVDVEYQSIKLFLVEEFIWFMQEEEAKARQAKEEEAAAMEFEKWKGAFSVDDEGSTENEVRDGNKDLLSEFVEYIKVVLSSSRASWCLHDRITYHWPTWDSVDWISDIKKCIIVLFWLLYSFIILQKHKCIPLEDLAAEFKLRTQVPSMGYSSLPLLV